MDERKRKVLHAIIQDYILTAEPVGSRTISRKYDMGVSSATIRNEMADLEEMGFIEQPYTSAGRIPSDKGYRYYVDFLMEKLPLSQEQQEFIHSVYNRKMAELEEVIRVSGELISQLTGYASITLGPHFGRSVIKLIGLTRVDPTRALLVVVTDTGLVEHRLLEVPEHISPRDLKTVSDVLGEKLRGLTLNEVSRTVFEEVNHEIRMQSSFLFDIFDLIEEVLQEDEGSRVYLDGTLNILRYPEFKNIERVQTILGLLQEKAIVKELVSQSVPRELTVKIGGENFYEDIRDCSLITATYSVDDQVVGTIGVLGPTRMEYSKAFSLVEYVTGVVSQVLSKYYS